MLAALISCSASILIKSYEEKSFLSWMRQSNQFFTGGDYHFRLGIFISNLRHVQNFNSVGKSFRVSLNKFSCYTPSEYNLLLGRLSSSSKNYFNRKFDTKAYKGELPDTVDWRSKGIVNTVKDQGQCGSCWAFGTIQACESAYALSYGHLFSCSEQNLVDCCTFCSGCSGGSESQALLYIIRYQDGFLNSEFDYPYTAIDGTCSFDQTKAINKISSYINGERFDENNLKLLVSNGVCIIAIDASKWSFQMYSGGIYDEPSCSSSKIGHSVGLVGYGTENGIDYWLVRNSWGENWGENGYIRMSRNKDNQCGVATDPLQVQA